MANLFWKTPRATTALLDQPFKTEEEFERTVFDTSGLLKDIVLLNRQVRGGNKPGIPDIIGLDGDGAICIIELKNSQVDADIIPQVLQYAVWAETNPDSIKSLWLQSANKHDDIKLSWDNPEVRILIIAPAIHRSTLAVVNKIGYPVDLIEVKRWTLGKDHFLLLNKLEEDQRLVRARRTVSGQRTYDAEFYRSEYNRKSADAFLKYADELQRLVKKNNWQLERKFNRNYCGFKAGFFNAFGIDWWGSKTFGLFVKISQADARRLRPRFSSYEPRWKQAYYPIQIGKTRMSDFRRILDLAYRNVAGGSDN